MASNAEMLRLVEHAVEKIQFERGHLLTIHSGSSVIGTVAAMTYAEAILGMIASCLMPDDVADLESRSNP
jgi:hypothetical protein